jgi:hypothetical protein
MRLGLVAEHDGPEMLARIGFMQALNRHSEKGDASATTEAGEGFSDRSLKQRIADGI